MEPQRLVGRAVHPNDHGRGHIRWFQKASPSRDHLTVTGELENGLTYLEVIGEQGQPRIARIHVKVFVSAEDAAATAILFEHVLDRLPLVCTLRAALALTIELIPTP